MDRYNQTNDKNRPHPRQKLTMTQRHLPPLNALRIFETAARARLTPLRRIGVPQRAEALQLLGLLQAHLARYARATDREVMGRLKDLGYL